MSIKIIHKIITYSIALVWIVNGLFCKVLNFSPRHTQIVAEILNLNTTSSYHLTVLIGLLEILMSLWIISGFKTKLNSIVQISVVASMNILEFFLVPDLLLWGKLNSIFALIFIILIYTNEFYINQKITLQKNVIIS